MVSVDKSGLRKTGFYLNSLEHLQAELSLTALKLGARARTLLNQRGENAADNGQGWYISEREIAEILANPGISTLAALPASTETSPQFAEPAVTRLEESIPKAKQAALQRGIKLNLAVLESAFQLSRFEVDTLLLCLLAEIDLRYQQLLAYCQDDITQKAPTLNFIVSLFYPTPAEAYRARQYFLSPAPLIRYRLVRLSAERESGAMVSLLGRAVHLDERITGFLLGQDQPEASLIPLVQQITPRRTLSDLIIAGAFKERLAALIRRNRQQPLVGCLEDQPGPHKTDLAEAICQALGTNLLVVNLYLLTDSCAVPELLIPLIFREAILQNATVFIEDFSALAAVPRENSFNSLPLWQREIAAFPGWVLLGTEPERPPRLIWPDRPCVNLRLPELNCDERLRVWQSNLPDLESLPGSRPSEPTAGDGCDNPTAAPEGFQADSLQPQDLADLAARFKFNPGQIARAAAAARDLARWREPELAQINSADLFAACRTQSGISLDKLATRVPAGRSWSDIILPRDQMEQLQEICSYLKHYNTVYERWGFGRRLSLGKGLKALFAGPSGTGKTMAAGIIAAELKIDLYKIDLSSVVSKYIGETEKNLDKIFQAGQTSNAILFFDEADALFGKRSEVRDAHDRYANIETAYLLQKMDDYEGTLILSTNLRKNLDEAFARRLHFAVEFPLPDVTDRRRIWGIIFPPEAPLDPQADLDFMARFKISGGNIKNIAVYAAFLAVQDGAVIHMEHLIRATRREFQKIGRLCTEDDFAQYYRLVKS